MHAVGGRKKGLTSTTEWSTKFWVEMAAKVGNGKGAPMILLSLLSYWESTGSKSQWSFLSIYSVLAQNAAYLLILNWHQLLLIGYQTSNHQAPFTRKSKEAELPEHMNSSWVDAPDGRIEFLVPQDNSGMLKFAMYEIECEDGRKV